MAILLGALLIQGLQPGPEMLTTDLYITFSMMWTLVIANVVGALLLMVWGSQIAKVTFIKGHLIVPVVCMFVFMGAWLANNSPGDLAALLIFGLVGYLMKQGGIPRPPLVLGFILGPIMEDALHITVSGYTGAELAQRPISMIILAGVVLTIAIAARSNLRQRKSADVKTFGETETWDPRISLFMLLVIMASFVYALIPAFSWPDDVGRIPMVTTIPGIALCVVALFLALRRKSPGVENGAVALTVPVLGARRIFLRVAVRRGCGDDDCRPAGRAAPVHGALYPGLGRLQVVARCGLRGGRARLSVCHVRRDRRRDLVSVGDLRVGRIEFRTKS